LPAQRPRAASFTHRISGNVIVVVVASIGQGRGESRDDDSGGPKAARSSAPATTTAA